MLQVATSCSLYMACKFVFTINDHGSCDFTTYYRRLGQLELNILGSWLILDEQSDYGNGWNHTCLDSIFLHACIWLRNVHTSTTDPSLRKYNLTEGGFNASKHKLLLYAHAEIWIGKENTELTVFFKHHLSCVNYMCEYLQIPTLVILNLLCIHISE